MPLIPPLKLTIPDGESIHLGREQKLAQNISRFAGTEPLYGRSGSETGHLAPVDKILQSDRPGLLPTQQLGYQFEKMQQEVVLEKEGLHTSYGIFGAPGSGKTYLFMYLLRQLLSFRRDDPHYKYGILILDPKAALIDSLRELVSLKEVQRERDLVVINARELQEAARGINVIDASVDEYALGDLLVLAARSAGISASEDYWFLEWANLFGASLFLLNRFDLFGVSHSGDVVTLKQLLDSLLLVRSDRTNEGEPRQERDIQRLARVARSQLKNLSADEQADAELAISQIERFFRTDYVDTIMAFISRAYGSFQRSQYHCFSPKHRSKGAQASFYDQIIEDGKIVLVSVSPSDPLTAKMLCTLIKCLFQQTVIQRKDRFLAKTLRNYTRPLLLACDEYAEIASEVPGQPMGDGHFFSLAREFGCMGLLATQSVNVLQATSLKENWRSVFSTFAAKIFMRLADNETVREASDLAGTSDWYITSRGLSQGKEGIGSSDQKGLQERQRLPAEITTQLQKGDGVVIGSLDGGTTPPRIRFFHVPNEQEQNAYLKRHAAARAAVETTAERNTVNQGKPQEQTATETSMPDIHDSEFGSVALLDEDPRNSSSKTASPFVAPITSAVSDNNPSPELLKTFDDILANWKE